MPEGASPRMLADVGFNAYRWLPFGHEVSGAAAVPPTDEGLYFWAYVFDRTLLDRAPGNRRDLEDTVRRLQPHPCLLGYENYNEVAMRWRHIDRRATPDEIIPGSRLLRELDPDHPIWLAHSCGRTVETLREYNGCMDVLGCNPYPIVPPGMRQHYGVSPDGRMLDCPDQSMHAVGRYTQKMLRVGQGRKPVWMLIQAMANENWFSTQHCPEMAGQRIDESKILYPTYEQMRFMAFDAVISGATGIALAMWKTPLGGDVWHDIVRLVGQLRQLHDSLAGAPVDEPMDIAYDDLGYTIWDGIGVAIRRHNHAIFVFAANRSLDPARATLRCPIFSQVSTAVVEGEDREVAIKSGALSDYFEPFAVHVYRLS